jgi:hypothetical protein
MHYIALTNHTTYRVNYERPRTRRYVQLLEKDKQEVSRRLSRSRDHGIPLT